MRMLVKVVIGGVFVFGAGWMALRNIAITNVVERTCLPEEVHVKIDPLYAGAETSFIERVAVGAQSEIVEALPSVKQVGEFGESVGRGLAVKVFYLLRVMKAHFLGVCDFAGKWLAVAGNAVSGFIQSMANVILEVLTPLLPYMMLVGAIWFCIKWIMGGFVTKGKEAYEKGKVMAVAGYSSMAGLGGAWEGTDNRVGGINLLGRGLGAVGCTRGWVLTDENRDNVRTVKYPAGRADGMYMTRYIGSGLVKQVNYYEGRADGRQKTDFMRGGDIGQTQYFAGRADKMVREVYMRGGAVAKVQYYGDGSTREISRVEEDGDWSPGSADL